jgi:aminomethyltransferase
MIRTTPFHDRTCAANETGLWEHWSGYLVAQKYQLSEKFEYFAIRNSAGLFDSSPLFKYRIHGPDAEAFLGSVLARDIRACAVGHGQYTAWLDDGGFVVEDGVIFRNGPDDYLLTCAEPNLAWFESLVGRHRVSFEDESEGTAVLAIQGPKSREILATHVPGIERVPYFGLCDTWIAGAQIRISRTGYTGDLGYEIWMDAGDALAVWDALIEAGRDYGIVPCGILAMDMARVEAGLFMIDVDYTAANHAWIAGQKSTPFEMGLGWTVALDKPGYFVGRRALEREHKEGSAWKLVGLDIGWQGLEQLYARVGLPPQIPGMAMRGSLPVMHAGKQVGYASTSTWSPVLKKYIALAHVQRPHYAPGTALQIEVTVEHHRLHAPATVAKLPFYEPEWKKK